MDMDGGPVFPHEIGSCKTAHPKAECCGLSIRDYFAAAVLVGLLNWDAAMNKAHTSAYRGPAGCQELANHAYKLADAMLAARTWKEKEAP